MINKKSILFLLIFSLSIFLFGEKSSNDIQKDIDKRNSQLNNLKNEIENVEIEIKKKIDEEINNQEIIYPKGSFLVNSKCHSGVLFIKNDTPP